MKYSFLAILVLVLSSHFFGQATSAITVVSKVDGEGIPNAHIQYSFEGSDEMKLTLTNYEGIAVIEGASGKKASLAISFLGFKTSNEQIIVGENYKIELVEESQTLNSLVVTGQYSENSPEKAVQRITIITEEKIQKMAAVNLRDVLSNEMNVRLSQDNVLGLSLIHI